MEDQFNDDPDKILEFVSRVQQLESNLANAKDLLKDARSQLKDARENTRIAQKQAVNTQKMFNGYRKKVIKEKKTESLRIQTAKSELARMRKDIFSMQRTEIKHQHSIKLAEHRTSSGIVGQSAKLNNSTNTMNQEKQIQKNTLVERLVWCKPGWVKKSQNITFLDFFRCPIWINI